METTLFNWLLDLTKGFANALTWLTQDISIGTLTLNPLMLISFGGLTAFISIAIVRWLLP